MDLLSMLLVKIFLSIFCGGVAPLVLIVAPLCGVWFNTVSNLPMSFHRTTCATSNTPSTSKLCYNL